MNEDLISSDCTTQRTAELVVLVDETGSPIGTTPKADVHTTDTRLHLAFSCYIFNRREQLLITRRALTKATWPGAWTNTCCGHPLPDEPLMDAVARRLDFELGIRAEGLATVLPGFRYRATMDNGLVENEICPVTRGILADSVQVHPAVNEVMQYRWVDWSRFVSYVDNGSTNLSPWCSLQIRQLTALGPHPLSWPARRF